MALFDENVTITPAPQRRMSRATLAGIWALAVALVVLLVLTFLPTSYVIQQPGPVYNTLGTAAGADGKQVPLISVDGAKTYPTDGTLDLLTVQLAGNREKHPVVARARGRLVRSEQGGPADRRDLPTGRDRPRSATRRARP